MEDMFPPQFRPNTNLDKKLVSSLLDKYHKKGFTDLRDHDFHLFTEGIKYLLKDSHRCSKCSPPSFRYKDIFAAYFNKICKIKIPNDNLKPSEGGRLDASLEYLIEKKEIVELTLTLPSQSSKKRKKETNIFYLSKDQWDELINWGKK